MSNNLRDQDGCHNCKHCYVWTDYDDGSYYFCDVEGDRPVCPSIKMGEATIPDFVDDFDAFEAAMEVISDTWDDWEPGHERDPWQICDKWEAKKD